MKNDDILLSKAYNLIYESKPQKINEEHSTYDQILNRASKLSSGDPVEISKEQAQELIKDYDLDLENGNGDLEGEKSALFNHNDSTLRLKKIWSGQYFVFNGAYQNPSQFN